MIASPETAPLTFQGETAVFAEPCGGPVTDLNVMTRRGRFDSQLTFSTAREPRELNAHAGATLILALSDLVVGCPTGRSEEHTSELQSRQYLVCRLLLEKKKKKKYRNITK